jgi:MFS transporter, DHA1 family, multidrug resistance protein
MENWKQTLYITFFAQMVSAVGFSIVIPFLPLYVEQLGTDTSLGVEFWSGMVFSSMAITMAIASPIWGTLADRYGRKLMVMRSMFGGALILLAMGFARSAEQLALLRALQGLITGTVLATNSLVAAAVPREQSGSAMGLLQGGFLGGIALGPLIGGFISDMFGFRSAFAITSVLLMVGGILVTLGVHEHFVPPPRDRARGAVLQNWRHVLHMPGVMLAYLVRFLSRFAPMLLLPFLPLFVSSLRPDASHQGTITGLIVGSAYAAGTVSSFFLGRLGDQYGHRRILIVSSFVAACCYALQGFAAEIWVLLGLQIVTGAAIGGTGPSLNALLLRYTRAGDEGVVYGFEQSVSAAARGSAPLLGAAIATWGNLSGVFFASGLVLLLASIVTAWTLREAAPPESLEPESLKVLY